jgi:predicted enzyme related to lactoylglutathione lyase
MTATPIARVILYVRDIPNVAAFYQTHFGFEPVPGDGKGWLELASPSDECCIALHQASTGQKRGSEIKIVFWVEDVRKFKREREARGLKFGVVHEAKGFQFSNAKDPAGNSISISSRPRAGRAAHRR